MRNQSPEMFEAAAAAAAQAGLGTGDENQSPNIGGGANNPEQPPPST